MSCQGAIIGDFANNGSSPPEDVGPSGSQGTDTSGVACTEAPALTGESQRLDPAELANALEVVLGFRPDMAGFPAPHAEAGYSTYPGANRIEYADIDDIVDVADEIGLQALDRFDTLLGCDVAAIDEACAQAFVERYAPRFYRETYEPSDATRLMDLYRTLISGADALSPDLAIAGVISAMLQSPAFLYLIEIGQATDRPSIRSLTNHEIANRLAFMIWDGPADAALTQAAERGDLRDGTLRRAEAERMLQVPAARPVVVQFFREWFGIDSADFTDRVDPSLANAWNEEFRRVVERLVFDTGPRGLPLLVADDRTIANRGLAEHYGISGPTDDETWADVGRPDGTRAGLLGSAAFAAAQSNPGGTSVIHRGRFVREALLCDPINNPPPGATDLNPVLAVDATVRDRIDARAAIGTCAGCHNLMDRIGVGMEDLDHLGRYRTQYDGGQAVDRSGEVAGYDNGAFVGVEGLAAFLTTNAEFSRCALEQWFRFAMGRPEGAECHAARSSEAFAESEFDLREMLLSVVESESFLLRTDPEGT